jgi:hypothetical protein
VSAAPFTRRIPRRFKKRITFANAAGQGAVGTVAVGTVTGQVLIHQAAAICLTDLEGATATIELGVDGDTAGIFPQITGTTLDVGEFWEATPSKIAAAIEAKVVNGNLIITVGTAALTAGQIEIVLYWLPLSDDGNIA